MSRARFPGFYKLSVEDRLAAIRKHEWLHDEDVQELLSGDHLLVPEIADKMIENVVGVMGLPFRVGLNFVINKRDYLIPLVVEEPSIVAALSSAAKTLFTGGGMTASADESLLIGQVQVVNPSDMEAGERQVLAHKAELLSKLNALHPNMIARGGGAHDIEVRRFPRTSDNPQMLVVHLLVDTCDAMGANMINTMCEEIAPDVFVGLDDGLFYVKEGEKIFSAGWDLKAVNSGEMSLENWWENADYGDGGFAGLTENWNLNKPVIGALNGLVIGGGFELALGCDLLIASEHVEFGLPEMPLGIVPDAGALQRLPRCIPYNVAMEMFLLGRRMSAVEAKNYGLVNKVVKHENLLDQAYEWAKKIATSAPLAMQSVKEVLRSIECVPLEKAFSKMRNDDLKIYTCKKNSKSYLSKFSSLNHAISFFKLFIFTLRHTFRK